MNAGGNPMQAGFGGLAAGGAVHPNDFHHTLVSMVPKSNAEGYTAPDNTPEPRANHTCTLVDDVYFVLFDFT